MPRGYRCVFLAFVGWLSLAASPPGQRTSNEQAQAKEGVESGLQKIAAALQEANRPSEPDPGCAKDKDNRKSDLCAQWKAADAAADGSLWAERSFFLSVGGLVVGVLTLIAAALAARFARDAALHTEAGAKEAKRGADAAERSLEHSQGLSELHLRAYLDIDSPTIKTDEAIDSDGDVSFYASVNLHNYGETPAKRIRYRSLVLRAEDPPSYTLLDAEEDQPVSSISRSDHFIVGDGIYVDQEFFLRLRKSDEEANLWWLLSFSYSDIFGKRYLRQARLLSGDGRDWYMDHDEEEQLLKESDAGSNHGA